MTNEQLAQLMQQGGNDELIPILWERVRRLMYMQSGKVYERRKLYFDKAGVELWDIKQTCYEVFLKAIDGYKPEQGNKFTAYLNYPFKTAINELLGIRTVNRNPLNDSISLDEPLDEAGETFLSDTIEDPKAAAEFEQVENDDVCSIVQNAVAQLEFEQRHVIQEKYFNDRSIADIAAQLNISKDHVRRIELAALKELRRSSVLQSLYKEEQIHNQLQILSRFRYSPQYFYLLDEILKLQAQGAISYGKAQAALYMAEMKYNKDNKLS